MGKFRGAEIELHWTFLLLMLFVLLADMQAFFLFVLFFVCVILHEMVHAEVAARNNVKAKRIVLYPLGGGTIIDPEDLTPKKEFIVSISGPIATLALATAFFAISLFTRGAFHSLMYLLAVLNMLLGVFNLLPWMPLDGGRALRGWLEKTRSHIDATRLTLLVSRVTMVAYVAISTAYIFLASYSTAYKAFLVLFNAVIALFIYGGTESEMLYATIRERTKDIGIRAALSRGYSVASNDAKIGSLVSGRGNPSSHTVLIKDGGTYKMLSNQRLRNTVLKHPDARDMPLGPLGIEIPTVDARISLFSAFQAMEAENVPVLAVTSHGRLAGIVHRQRLEYVMMLHMRPARAPKKTVK